MKNGLSLHCAAQAPLKPLGSRCRLCSPLSRRLFYPLIAFAAINGLRNWASFERLRMNFSWLFELNSNSNQEIQDSILYQTVAAMSSIS